jgi:hypothetical protein
MADNKKATASEHGEMVPSSESGSVVGAPRRSATASADSASAKKIAELHSPVKGATLAHPADAELHPAGEPEREADKTSAPNALDAEPHDPPIRVAKPTVEGIRTLATGAGKHTPPDPDAFTAEGRMVYDRKAAGEGKLEKE